MNRNQGEVRRGCSPSDNALPSKPRSATRGWVTKEDAQKFGESRGRESAKRAIESLKENDKNA